MLIFPPSFIVKSCLIHSFTRFLLSKFLQFMNSRYEIFINIIEYYNFVLYNVVSEFNSCSASSQDLVVDISRFVGKFFYMQFLCYTNCKYGRWINFHWVSHNVIINFTSSSVYNNQIEVNQYSVNSNMQISQSTNYTFIPTVFRVI